jgi:hypothetical protein
MSQVVEGTEDNLTKTRRALTAGNTANSLQPMDVAEAAYYKQHPDEAPGAENPVIDPEFTRLATELTAGFVTSVASAVAEAQAAQGAPEEPVEVTVVYTDFEITPENADFVKKFVSRAEFNRLAGYFNELLYRVDELEGRIEQFNKTAPHKIK